MLSVKSDSQTRHKTWGRRNYVSTDVKIIPTIQIRVSGLHPHQRVLLRHDHVALLK